MALAVTCPFCRARYTLGDDLAGCKARCKKCQKSFIVDAGNSQPVASPTPATPKSKFRLVLAGSIAAGLLVVVGVILAIVLLVPQEVDQKLTDLKAGDPQTRREALAWLVDADVQDEDRPKVTAALEPLLIDGDSTAVLKPDLLLRAYLHWADANIVPAMVRMVEKAGNPQIRRAALAWLADADVRDKDRPKVTAALEPLLVEGDSSGALKPDVLLRAYLHWADTANVPAMVRMVENGKLPSPGSSGQVMQTLGKLQDRRAIDILVQRLSDPKLHESALTALQLMGSRAEKEVLDALFDPDAETSNRASQLLADYGTRRAAIADAARNRLQATQASVQHTAAAWFAANPPDNDAEKAAVAPLLVRLLDSLSPRLNAQALLALRQWATKDCLPNLLAYARRQDKTASTSPVLITVLAQFPDERAAEAIALQLPKEKLRLRAVQALLKLDKAATGAVLHYLNYPNEAVQHDARDLCRQLNISAARQLEQTLADVAGTGVKRSRAALLYLARLRPSPADRAKVAKALNAPLLDSDPGIRDAALAAVKVWCTRDNTATLLKLLGNFQSGGKERNAQIIDVLGTLKDPAAAGALAQGLTHEREHSWVSKALKSIGPAAEDAVIPFIQSVDRGARIEACVILADIGTAKSLKPLQAGLKAYYNDPIFIKEAQIAAQKIMARR